MLGHKKGLEHKLAEQGGTVAWATVISAKHQWDSSSNSGVSAFSANVTEHMKVTLNVQPDDEPAFEATLHQAFSGASPMDGWQVKVIFDPADHSKIAIQEDQIFPPGISHDRLERGAEIRSEAIAAANSGNMAEFVEQMKAKAMRGELNVQGTPLVISAAGVPAKPDVADQLTKLADLRDRGVLTDDEFAAQKAKLLAAS
jgi:hypothetical protein